MQPRSQTRNTAANQPVQFRYELEKQIPSGKVVIEIENQQAIKSALFIFNPGEKPTPVLSLKPSLNGKKLLTNQTFRDLFRSEVIRENETLAIKDITFLFTDLKGSTSMYEEIGDAKAYFLVHQHFDALRRVIRQHNGAIVKTIGDAVMAVFDTPIDATRAALSMLDALNEFNATISEDLILKVGIHCGHSIAVAVNEGNDYFGQNVNIAARVQALADCNEIYISSDAYNSPGVSEALSNHQVVSDEVQMGGFSETIQVYKISPISPG
jgi:class 3 adenylate cyclase